MADKRISQLVDRGTVLNNDVVPIVVSGATTTNKATISSIQTFMQGNLDLGVTSVGITLGSSGTDVNVTGSPVTTSGNITINIPDASATARGVVSTGTQTFAGAKTFNSDIVVNGITVGKGGSANVNNTAVGSGALAANTTGSSNTATGLSALLVNTGGNANTANGYLSLQANTTGGSNASVGNQSLYSNTTGSNNTAVGNDSLYSNITGDKNTGIGAAAGYYIADGSTPNTTSDFSIYLGADTKASVDNAQNETVIGYNAIGSGSNTVTIGNSSITDNYFTGTVRSTSFRLEAAGTADPTFFRNTSGTNSVTANSNVLGFNGTNNIFVTTQTSGGFVLAFNNSTSNKTYTLQDADGTLAFTSQIPSVAGVYLPLAGGTLTGALNGTSASFNAGINAIGQQKAFSWQRTAGTASDVYSLNADSGSTYLQNDTTSNILMSWLEGGNVGIGTASAAAKLTIVKGSHTSTIGASSVLQISDTSAAGEAVGDRAEINFYTNSDSIGGNLQHATIGIVKTSTVGNETADLYFGTSTVGGSAVERMRITSAGNVIIGGNVSGTSLNTTLTINSPSAGNYSGMQPMTADVQRGYYAGTSSGLEIGVSGSGFLGIHTSGTERMRITSGGYTKASNNGTYFGPTNPSHEFNQTLEDWNTQFINTHASVPYGIFVQYSASPNNTGSEFLFCRDGAGSTVRVAIRSNGGLANYQANNVNLSDERTKKDIEPLESYWDKFKAIEIVKFKYKDQTHDDFNIGVIAQQVEAVAPEFVDVDGWNNKPELDEEGNEILSDEEPLKSIYTADLYHATIKVLQEAMAKIEKLEIEIDSLKKQIK